MDTNTILRGTMGYRPGYEQDQDQDHPDHNHLSLELSLAIHHPDNPPPMPPMLAAVHHPIILQQPFQPPPLPPPHMHQLYFTPQPITAATPISPPPPTTRPPQPRVRSSGPRNGKPLIIPAPYPWATNKRAVVHSLEYLNHKGILSISGQLQCKRCEHIFEQTFDLAQKFREVVAFVAINKSNMHNRAPKRWQNPVLPVCPKCNQNNVKPYITKKRSINWLFLFLGEYLSCCKISELKYFCKHTSNHRTGAKDRLIYIAYIGLCKQLDSAGPY